MRSIRRAIIVGALSVPLVLGASATAFADTGSGGPDYPTEQGRLSIAPVTQFNPAIDLAGLFDGFPASSRDYRGGFTGGDATSGLSGITQHDSITSTNTQNTTSSSTQLQTAVQSLGQGTATGQGNLNVAPITQIHSAINVAGVIRSSSNIEQNNTVTSTNNQSNILSGLQSAGSQRENTVSREFNGQDNYFSGALLGGLLGSLLN